MKEKGRTNHMKNLRTSLGGTIFALALVLGITALAGTAAQAQYRNDRNVQRQNDSDARAWRRNRNQNPHRRYDRDGREIRDNRDYGRSRGYGNDGYNNGVYGNNDGYGNNGGYRNNGGYGNANQMAKDQGYQYGLNTGASDAQRGQSFSPQRSHYYKDASSQAFRNGFVQGYNQGYRQYAGNGNRNGTYRRGNTQGGIGGILGGILNRP